MNNYNYKKQSFYPLHLKTYKYYITKNKNNIKNLINYTTIAPFLMVEKGLFFINTYLGTVNERFPFLHCSVPDIPKKRKLI